MVQKLKDYLLEPFKGQDFLWLMLGVDKTAFWVDPLLQLPSLPVLFGFFNIEESYAFLGCLGCSQLLKTPWNLKSQSFSLGKKIYIYISFTLHNARDLRPSKTNHHTDSLFLFQGNKGKVPLLLPRYTQEKKIIISHQVILPQIQHIPRLESS